MKQKEIEQKLTELQSTNRKSPEIYELLVELTGNMLKSQNWLLSEIDFDNVTHDVAAELYMKVYNNIYTVQYWRALAYRLIKFSYVKKQRKMAMTQTFDTEKDPTQRELIYRSCASYVNESEKEFAISENKAYLSDMRRIINDVMDASKFNKNSADYMNLKMSVALSLLYNEDKYWHLKPSLRPYSHILVQRVKETISDSGFFTIANDYDITSCPDFDNALMPDLEFLGLTKD